MRTPRRNPPGNTTRAGYGTEHQRLREQWRPVVDAGAATCHAPRCVMPSRRIAPGTPWHLGHTLDRTGWRGPEHAACNLREGAIKGNTSPRRKRRRRIVVRFVTSRAW